MIINHFHILASAFVLNVWNVLMSGHGGTNTDNITYKCSSTDIQILFQSYLIRNPIKLVHESFLTNEITDFTH